MPVVLLLTAVAILAGVVVVAVGRGGELAIFRSDAPPLRHEFASAADLASWRPPTALFGYSAQATDDALQRIARTVADRDAELAMLRSQLAELRADPGRANPAAPNPGTPNPAAPSAAAPSAAAPSPGATEPGAPPEPTEPGVPGSDAADPAATEPTSE
jgi:hypothetical protein